MGPGSSGLESRAPRLEPWMPLFTETAGRGVLGLQRQNRFNLQSLLDAPLHRDRGRVVVFWDSSKLAGGSRSGSTED